MITRNTDYAMRALCYIAEEGKDSVTADEMVTELRIPRPFLRKLLQRMSAEGILRSFKGAGGGFALAKKPGAIKITDLICVFQGTVELNECVFKKKLCPNRATCKLRVEIDSIQRDVLARLSKVSIASLMNPGSRSRRVPRRGCAA